MPEGYTSLLVYLALLCAIGGGFICLTILIPRLLKIQRTNPDKLDPYECGVPEHQSGARGRFEVRFYLLAILFILFDVEVVFLLPYAAEFKSLGLAATIEVAVFLILLIAGYAYVWKRGALEWE